jgi:hypothetical protein
VATSFASLRVGRGFVLGTAALHAAVIQLQTRSATPKVAWWAMR